MPKAKTIFDFAKAKAATCRGRRSKWWQRRGSMKRGFHYLASDGVRITDEAKLERIKLLVVPPAWTCVRINPSAGGRIQAIGVDTTGRVQYIYHPTFVQKQQRKKFAKIETFGEFLPQLRAVTNEHIVLDGFPREKVLAIIIRLINSLYIRVGSEKSAKHFRTYGVTTLKNDHLTIGKKGELLFEFVGKSHVLHRKVLVDAELAAVMAELKNIGVKRKLFHYVNGDGKPRPVKPGDINSYIKTSTAPHFSAKDFRTWGATLLAAAELAEIGPAEDLKQAEKNIVQAIKKVAAALGNTPTVCRGSYIHPLVLEAYRSGITLAEFRPRRSRSISRLQAAEDLEEQALLRMFKSQNGHG